MNVLCIKSWIALTLLFLITVLFISCGPLQTTVNEGDTSFCNGDGCGDDDSSTDSSDNSNGQDNDTF